MTRRIRQLSRNRQGEVRPTTSRVLSALFSMFGPGGVEGLSVLDLYAGTGGFGLEALRRGAARVVMVEQNRRRCEDLKLAVEKAGAQTRASVITGDAIKSLRGMQGPFDVVFADPPYADNPFEALATMLEREDLLTERSVVLLEHFHKTVLPDRLANLLIRTRRRYGDAAVSVYEVPRKNVEHTGEGA